MIDHTADVAVRVQGRSPEQALARLVVVFGQLLTGAPSECESPHVEREGTVMADAGEPPMLAIDILRELLYRFSVEGAVPVRCEVRSLDPVHGAEVRVGFGRYDPQVHSEGMDVKAVTLHEAAFDREDDRWVVQVLLDV